MEDNKAYEAGAVALSSRPKAPKVPGKKATEIHAKKVKGGYSVMTHFAHPAHKPEESVHPDVDSVHDHMEKHWGTPNEGEAEMMESSPAGAPDDEAQQ